MAKWKAELYKKLFWGMIALNVVLVYLLVWAMRGNLELLRRIN